MLIIEDAVTYTGRKYFRKMIMEYKGSDIFPHELFIYMVNSDTTTL
jgi:hypothetical protein